MSHQTDVLHRFGLRFNPFVDEIMPEDAFLTDQRSQLLDKLSHLSRYSQFVLVVSGAHGIGKSTFLNQLLPGSDPVMRPVVLRLQHETGPAQMVTSLVQAARVDLDGEVHFEAQVQALQQHALMLRELNRMMLILIDDAELLTDAALDVLFTRLMQTPDPAASPHIILLGQPDMLGRLGSPRLQSVLAGRSHHAALDALSLDETEAYIRHRMELAGLHGEVPFTMANYSRIHQLSGGNPAQINRIAQAMLMELGGAAAQATGRSRATVNPAAAAVSSLSRLQLPWMHIAAVAILVLTIGGAFLLSDGKSADEQQVALNQQVQIPLPNGIAPATTTAEPTQAGAAPVAPAPAAAPPTPESPLSLSERLALQEAKLGINNGQDDTMPPPDSTVDQIPVPVAPAQVQSTPVQPAQVARPVQPSKPVVAAPPKVEQPVAQPVRQATPTVAAKPASGGSTYRRDAMVKGWNPGGYTLQMLGSRSEQGAIDFIRQNGGANEFSYFQTEYKGQPWYVVVYGEYASRDAAQTAANRLPASLQKQKPWPRSIRGVQQEIR
ncbi:hypothetical protein C4K68_20840 [Pokkaliibacter plantistimulans]|uniref:SPOR domain-containing protein n=1 Tax=Proteobacteria bacterium 228 TaxID=2083153 RepID=A0A2S5KKQ0_9PROT|nr:SPOR domain-containing protein [Pokkaliibacter plantistimulans]PPC75414.1 hypothetical protein C4K68_20840 [Pokkaliibacter plantistimulans]